MGSFTIAAQVVLCFSYPALRAQSSASVRGLRYLHRVFPKERCPIGEGGADFAGLMRTCIRVALLVGVAEVGAEPACKRVS